MTPANLFCGNGWVFWNEDTGEEYSPDHPVRSGICPGAKRIRRSTEQEDLLWHAYQAATARNEDHLQ